MFEKLTEKNNFLPDFNTNCGHRVHTIQCNYESTLEKFSQIRSTLNRVLR